MIVVVDLDGDSIDEITMIPRTDGAIGAMFDWNARQPLGQGRQFSNFFPGDFDGDGDPDLITLGEREIEDGERVFSWMLFKNDIRSTGAFEAPVMVNLDSSQMIDVVDFNGDGIDDLLTSDRLWESAEDGTFEKKRRLVGLLDIGNFDNEGSLDLLRTRETRQVDVYSADAKSGGANSTARIAVRYR